MNTVTTHEDGTGTLRLDGVERSVQETSVEEARAALLRILVDEARLTNAPVAVVALEPSGQFPLLVHPDGSVDAGDEQESPGRDQPTRATGTEPRHTGLIEEVPRFDRPGGRRPETVELDSSAQITSRREARERSFLTVHEDDRPASSGWRGFLARLGLRPEPSPAEKAYRADVRAVSAHWPGPRTIAIVNGKGGAGKTPTTVLLSALFARHGGSGVLAWDNNETRGTLGWRTEQGPHESHVLDLLPYADSLMLPTARAADLAAYVHHQTADKFEVLRSNPTMLPHQQRLTTADFDAVHAVATKYYRLILVDSGNDETAPHWLRMIDAADQLVVATTTRPDHAEAGRLLLEALRDRDAHSAALADQAVVIVSQADREEASASTIAEGYEGLARTAVTIPYDKAMRTPWLRLDNLDSATQRAYLAAAAAVAAGL